MAPRHAKFLTYGDDDICNATRKFIEDAGVILHVRDIEKDPLSEEELHRLVGYLQVGHFLNRLSPAYEKFKLDGMENPDREQVIKLMAKDHTLIRRPIVISTRLKTIGCDKKKIADMLQINVDNGEPIRQTGPKSGSRRVNA